MAAVEDVEAAVDGDDALALGPQRRRQLRRARAVARAEARRCPGGSPPASPWPCRTCRRRRWRPGWPAPRPSRDRRLTRGQARTRRRPCRPRRSRRTLLAPASAARTARRRSCCRTGCRARPASARRSCRARTPARERPPRSPPAMASASRQPQQRARFLPVRRQIVAALVALPILRTRIDDHLEAGFVGAPNDRLRQAMATGIPSRSRR